jgi:poly-gamma-glutamate synthesis protein (capsule biosynthesis protein)
MRRAIQHLLLALIIGCGAYGAAPAKATSTTETEAESVTLVAVGDLMLARSIGAALATKPDESPFAGVASLLQTADIAVGNLECALGASGTPARKAYTFRGPATAAASLAAAGFDLLALANNHSLDYGLPALEETTHLLDTVGIAHPGAGLTEADAHRPAIIEAHGLRLAFLSYVDIPTEKGGFVTASWRARGERPGVAWALPQRISADVADAHNTADLVIVLLHSGYEGVETPNPIQRDAAHAAINAGAVLVIGSHPHVLQGIEHYGNGVIAYSLGNFVFDGLYKRSETAMLHVTLTRAGVQALSWTPVVLRDGRPQMANEQQAAIILKRIERLSARLARR